MIEKYNKNKSKRRVCFHLGACTLLFLIFGIISESITISIILLLIFLGCLFIYIYSRKKMNEIEKVFIDKCVKCNNIIQYDKTTKHFLFGQYVSETDFTTNISNDKKKIEIEKYYCSECKLCFSIIKTYQINNKGDFILIKTEKNFDEEYNNNY